MNGLLYFAHSTSFSLHLFVYKFYSCCQVDKCKKKYNNANTKCLSAFQLKISTETISEYYLPCVCVEKRVSHTIYSYENVFHLERGLFSCQSNLFQNGESSSRANINLVSRVSHLPSGTISYGWELGCQGRRPTIRRLCQPLS